MAKKKCMSKREFTEAMEQFGAQSQGEAARLLGVGHRSVLRYFNGTSTVPEYLRRLILTWQKHGVPKEFQI